MPPSRATSRATIRNAISQISPLIIGHRGASALAPENTLAAFARAFADGAAGIELDVRLAKDGVPVVIHDATLRRTGLMLGEVAQMTSKEHPKIARAEYEQQRVPTLSDVFRFFSDKPGVIYIELKTDDADSSSDLVQAVADAVISSGFQDRVVVVSFELAAVVEIKSLNSSIRTGAVFAPRRRPNLSWRADSILNAATECGADELLPHRFLARSKLIDKARTRNLPVIVWTVDDQAWVARAKTLDVHALINERSGAHACCRNSLTFSSGLPSAGSFRGRTCPAIKRRTSAASKRRGVSYVDSKPWLTCESRTSHVSSSVCSFVLNIRR